MISDTINKHSYIFSHIIQFSVWGNFLSHSNHSQHMKVPIEFLPRLPNVIVEIIFEYNLQGLHDGLFQNLHCHFVSSV